VHHAERFVDERALVVRASMAYCVADAAKLRVIGLPSIEIQNAGNTAHR
jgi:hypothetical protein